MAMTLHVDIVSAEEEIYSGTAHVVHAPAQMGEVGIYPRHAPFLAQLKPGTGQGDVLRNQGIFQREQHLIITDLARHRNLRQGARFLCLNGVASVRIKGHWDRDPKR